MSNFENDILTELEDLDLETLVRRDNETNDSAVKIIHKLSGSEFVCEKYDSQVKNKAGAILQLLKSLQENFIK
jgi:hypothetical protein